MQAEAEIEKSTEERFIMVDDIRAKGSEGLSQGFPAANVTHEGFNGCLGYREFPGQ